MYNINYQKMYNINYRDKNKLNYFIIKNFKIKHLIGQKQNAKYDTYKKGEEGIYKITLHKC